jgi:putative transposase
MGYHCIVAATEGCDKLTAAVGGYVGRVPAVPYSRHRFLRKIIAHAVWLCFRFALSFHDVEELLAARGVMVSYEAVRFWCAKCGPAFADRLRRARKPVGRPWFLDEVFVRRGGVRRHLWRAVDRRGFVIDLLVQPRRDRAAERFFRHLLHSAAHDHDQPPGQRPSRALTGAAQCSTSAGTLAQSPGRELAPAHPGTRAAHGGFKSPAQAQRFVSIHNVVTSHFRPRRHRMSAGRYRAVRQQRFRVWNHVPQTTALTLTA